jgi:hypothetical protein
MTPTTVPPHVPIGSWWKLILVEYLLACLLGFRIFNIA